LIYQYIVIGTLIIISIAFKESHSRTEFDDISTDEIQVPLKEDSIKSDKGKLHSRVENLTQIQTQCIAFRDKILSADKAKLNFGDKFKILELIQAAHELKYQRIMREVLFKST